MACIEIARDWRLESLQCRDCAALHVCIADNFGVEQIELGQDACIRLSIERGNHSRREQLNDVARLAEIRRHQRVGGRHRAVRNTGPHGCKTEHEMLDAIARQNQDRPLLREVPVGEPGRDPPHAIEHFGVADALPFTACGPSSDEHPIGRDPGPVLKEVHEPCRVLGQSALRLQQKGAVCPPLELRPERIGYPLQHILCHVSGRQDATREWHSASGSARALRVGSRPAGNPGSSDPA